MRIVCTVITAVSIGLTAKATAQPVCESAHIANLAPIFSSFGSSVAIDGSTAVVSAPGVGSCGVGPVGTAAIFTYSDTGGWTALQELHPPDPQFGAQFGRIVAIEDDVIAVASACKDENASHSGSVYVFRNLAGTWVFEQKLFLTLTAGPCSTCLGFGRSIVIDEGRLAVAAAGGTTAVGFYSRVHIYQHDGESWVETHFINMDEANGLLFTSEGRLALRGDLLVGGAPGDDSACPNDQQWQKNGISCNFCDSGAVYVLRYDPGGDEWAVEAKIMPDDLLCEDGFGGRVAVDGERIIARRFWPRSVHVFEYDADSSSWVEQAQIFAPSVTGLIDYGRSIKLRGNTALVGGATGGGPHAGFAFVYQPTPSGEWMQREVLTPDPALCCSGYGLSVALTDEWAIVGAPQEGGGGAAYIYDMQPPMGDLTCDDTVGVNDLLELLAAWGECPEPGKGITGCPGDLNSDGTVGVADLLTLLANWG